MNSQDSIAAVVIGRNEGQRLVGCLASLSGEVKRIVYVDSGSTDGSVEVARRAGVKVVLLDMSRPFTAARARNAGISYLASGLDAPEYVQFIDGDCELRKNWIKTAEKFLGANLDAAAVCGRRRERHPEISLWNQLIDSEWNTPVGEVKACGGDALFRFDAVIEVGGFNSSLIAGEEPELCLRLRRLGWRIFRIDVEMTLHDAAMTHFFQWWKRAQRAGHAYAEGANLHGFGPEHYNITETSRALFWGMAIPVFAIVFAILVPLALLIILAWPLQVVRLARRDGDWTRAFFLTLGKIPEAQGIIGYYFQRLCRRRKGLIEYK